MIKTGVRKALIAVTLSALVAGCGSESGTNLSFNGDSGSGQGNYAERSYVIRGQIPLTRSSSGVAGIPVIAKEYNPVNPDSKVYRSATDSNGNFEIKVDHPGTYVVMADGGRRGKAVRTVEVRADSNIVNLGQIRLTATGNIEGFLTYDGYPIKGAVVYIPGTSYIAITDKTGHFKISDVPVNEGNTGYRLVVKAMNSGHGYSYEEERDFGILGIIQLNPLTPSGIQIVKDLARVEPRLLHYRPIDNEFYVMFNGKEIFVRNFRSEEDSSGYDYYHESYYDGVDAPGFRLVFEKPMDKESLFDAIEILDSSNQTVDVADKSDLIEVHTDYGPGWYKVYINTSKLKPGKYVLKIDKSRAKSTYGVNLAEDVEIPFEVGDFIGDVVGDHEKAGIDEPVEIHFSAPVDRQSVIDNLKVQDSNGNTPEGLKLYFEPDNMTVYVSAVFKEGEKYTFSFENGTVKTFDGFTFINLPFEDKFSMIKPRMFMPSFEVDWNEVPKDFLVRVAFNVLMDRDSVEKSLKVIDETNNETIDDVSIQWSSMWIEFHNSNYYPQNCDGDQHYEWCGGNIAKPATGDFAEIKFDKEYGHTYKIVIDNAKSAKGTPLEKFEAEFTVLTPQFKGVDVQNGDVIEPYESIKVYANVPVSDKEGTYSIQYINKNDPSDTINGILEGNEIRPAKPLAPDSEYVLKIDKLQSFDGYDLITQSSPFTVTIKTFRKHIVGSFPYGGQSWVCDGNHHVVIDWNVALTDEEKEALKKFIKVDAYPYYSHGTGSTPTHPDVNVVFGTWGQGQTRMYVDFTWDPDTNYRVYFGDDNGTIVTEIPVTDESGNVTGYLYPDKVIVFTTAPEGVSPANKSSFIYGTNPTDGGKVSIYDYLTVTISTYDGWCCNNLPTENIDIEVKECELSGTNCEILNAITDYKIDFGYYNSIYLRIYHPDFYKKYEVTVKKLIPVYDWAKDYYLYPDGEDESTFYKFSFFTGGPELWINVNNANGYISFSGNALFNVKELKDALKLQPDINCIWNDDNSTSDDQEYVTSLICYYSPIQYANVGIDIPEELTAYEPEEVFDNSTNSTTTQYNVIGKFENTPLSQVCTVNPDITLPKLEKVEVVENNPDEGYAVINLHFNEKLDAESFKSANITVSYQDGNNTVNVPIEGSPISAYYGYCEETGMCVEPDVRVKLKDYIKPGVIYTVKVTGVKEFGGHYEITEEDGTATFKYTGKIMNIAYAGYRYSDNGTNKYKFLFLVNADVPLLENQPLTYELTEDSAEDVNIDLDLRIDSDYHKSPDTVTVRVDENHLGLVADYTVSSDYYCSYCYRIEDIYVRDILNEANETLPMYSRDVWYWGDIPSINSNILTPQVLNATEEGIYVTFGSYPQGCVFDNSIYKLLECDANDTENCTESSITVTSVNSTNETNVFLLKTSEILDNSTTYKLQVENLLSDGINFPCEALKPLGIEEVRESEPFQLSSVSEGNGTESGNKTEE